MYHYEYVTKKEAEPYRYQIEEIIHQVQDIVRDNFTFRYTFIGSSARNMITYDPKTKMGFDFDINFYPNDDDNIYSPNQLKQILMNAINQVAPNYGFKYCEDSTRVITVKKLNPWTGAVTFSFDIAIVHNYDGPNGEPRQEYIRFNKKQGSYSWEDQPNGYHLSEKVKWIKSQKDNLWNDVLDLYLDKKNRNTNPTKKSRALYAETIHEICQQNGYYQQICQQNI